MTNLLEETIGAIARSGHAVADITFIGSADGEYACTWAEFEVLANKEYDSGFGAAEVAGDLVVRFADGKHMWRYEYDGSECWEFDSPLAQQWEGEPKSIDALIGGLWRTLADLNA